MSVSDNVLFNTNRITICKMYGQIGVASEDPVNPYSYSISMHGWDPGLYFYDVTIRLLGVNLKVIFHGPPYLSNRRTFLRHTQQRGALYLNLTSRLCHLHKFENDITSAKTSSVRLGPRTIGRLYRVLTNLPHWRSSPQERHHVQKYNTVHKRARKEGLGLPVLLRHA